MPLSWNEIKSRALNFSKEWKEAHYEKGETQSFYNDFFDVFGISRRKVGFYEQSIKKLDNRQGFIDLFWPGTLLVEQKSAGRSLKDAKTQAMDYLQAVTGHEFPRYILVSDFQNFDLLDLETSERVFFSLSKLHENVQHFAFIAGYKAQVYRDQDPANIEASELMGQLHQALDESGYKGHDLEVLLVRLMFCLFADDTGIFERDHFLFYLENHTKEDGSDLGGHLITLFDVLNTPEDQRQKTLDEDLMRFQYVNGALFEKPLRPVSFDKVMRDALLQCCYFDWSKVSPALFGSLFQTVMQPLEQRRKGAYYTSEKNILKVIKPLFMDELWQEFEKVKTNDKKLREFHKKLGRIRIFDPACGCGNFLILAYRELRELELEILKKLYAKEAMLDVKFFSKIDVDQFYGIELEEFPARIAETAMWLVDHQMNIKLSEAFGQTFVRLPLKKSAKIVHGNALTTDWKNVLDPEQCSFIIGNPPFVGSKFMDIAQRKEIGSLFSGLSVGVLDYVCGWYAKAADYMEETKIKAAFVSTNSITQGEQVGILWNELINRRNSHLHFAHRTFKWTIDAKKAKGMKIAAVYVVIIGFADFETDLKKLYEYETVNSEPHGIEVKQFNPYLVEGSNSFVFRRGKPLSDVPEIRFGNMPNDGGFLLLNDEEKEKIIKQNIEVLNFIRPFISAHEFLNGKKRWCLWLKDVPPEKYRKIPEIIQRIESTRSYRGKSTRETTRKLGLTPALFGEIRQPETNYVLIPRHSSESRNIVPVDFCDSEQIVADSCLAVPNATLYHFGVLTSAMHMAWVRYVCGRLKSDYRYSKNIVYNNFPWPEPTGPQKKKIEEKAQSVLSVRTKFPDSSLADLYDPNTMPHALLKAHQALDKAVDRAYRKTPFKEERTRIEFLFNLYQKITEPLLARQKNKRRNKV